MSRQSVPLKEFSHGVVKFPLESPPPPHTPCWLFLPNVLLPFLERHQSPELPGGCETPLSTPSGPPAIEPHTPSAGSRVGCLLAISTSATLEWKLEGISLGSSNGFLKCAYLNLFKSRDSLSSHNYISNSDFCKLEMPFFLQLKNFNELIIQKQM